MLYKDKTDWIVRFVSGKKVLDLGCVRHNLEETQKKNWLHGIIVKKAETVLGVDYLANAVKALRERGFNIICANVETMKIGENFELIVAGDLIEHLNNFGMFLERVREHMTSDGVTLITTPNPVNPIRFFSLLFRGEAGANPEHTCWFTEQVLLQLIERHGFEVSEVAYVDDTYQYYPAGNFKWWPFLAINYLLVHLRPAFAETLCMAIKIRQTN